jgi:hypothetical protein
MFALADPPPKFEYVPSVAVGPDLVGVQRGREGFRRVVEGFWDEFEDRTSNSTSSSMRETRCSSRPPSGGVESTAARRRAGDLSGPWVVRVGRVVRWQGFTDRDAALEAAGLRE